MKGKLVTVSDTILPVIVKPEPNLNPSTWRVELFCSKQCLVNLRMVSFFQLRQCNSTFHERNSSKTKWLFGYVQTGQFVKFIRFIIQRRKRIKKLTFECSYTSAPIAYRKKATRMMNYIRFRASIHYRPIHSRRRRSRRIKIVSRQPRRAPRLRATRARARVAKHRRCVARAVLPRQKFEFPWTNAQIFLTRWDFNYKKTFPRRNGFWITKNFGISLDFLIMSENSVENHTYIKFH